MATAMMTHEDIYIGNFLIDVFSSIEKFRDIYLDLPQSVAVDEKHYELIENCNYRCWVNKDSMKLKNGVQVVKETRWNGSFMSMRGNKYKR